MLHYLDGGRLWQLIEDDIYDQVNDIILNLKIDDLISVWNCLAVEQEYKFFKNKDGSYDSYVEEDMSAEDVRYGIWNVWDGITYEELCILKNNLDIYEIGKIIEEIKEIQDVFGV